MGNKPWADDDNQSPLSEFIGYFLAGIITYSTAIAWIPLKFGMNPWFVGGIGFAISLWLALHMAIGQHKYLKEKKQKEDAHATKNVRE